MRLDWGVEDHARQRLGADPSLNLTLCQSSEEITSSYELLVCFKTMERLPLDHLDSFLLGWLTRTRTLMYR